MTAELKAGREFQKTARLNGSGDLAMDSRIRPYIYQTVQVIKVCKSGLVQIQAEDGKIFSVPKRNLAE